MAEQAENQALSSLVQSNETDFPVWFISLRLIT